MPKLRIRSPWRSYKSLALKQPILRGFISGSAIFGLFVGWKVFLFQTDDAYISFRYISNRHLGFGYTWNPPPFLPVEGYTSFLWIVLLDLIWTVLGIEPPEASQILGLLF